MIWAEYYLPGFSEYFECLFELDATSCGLEPITRPNRLFTVKGSGSGLHERVHAVFVNAIMKTTHGQSIDFLKNNEYILANLNSCLGYIASLQEAIGDLFASHLVVSRTRAISNVRSSWPWQRELCYSGCVKVYRR